MNKINLVSDGTLDLPQEIIDKYNVKIAHLTVRFGDEVYIGGVELDNPTFYKKMGEAKDLPKTACPSPDDFKSLYEQEGDVIVLNITAGLSATHHSAILGKNLYFEEHPDMKDKKRIEVLDTDQGSVAMGLMVIKAGRMIEEGKSFEEIVESVKKWTKEVVHYGTLDTLENAVKAGRVKKVAGMLINALNFKPIIHISDSAVKPIDKARGETSSLKKVIDYVLKNGTDNENRMFAIGHANSPEKAEKVKKLLLEQINCKEVVIAEIGPVIGTYAAEGGILIASL